ncbi:MAG: DUF2188 domain-containing protein [Gallicola sp.]|nr:DUF2188 domain-containing protein [Gallicola sp.]
MPWNEKDYPDSWKNFDPITRRKAIDIANAMIKDGYEEGQAIPIATTQAKEWVKDASKEEIKALKKKDITSHKKDGDGPKYMDQDVEVRYREEEKSWEVRSKGAERADSLHKTKKEALERAKEIAENRDQDIIDYKKNE